MTTIATEFDYCNGASHYTVCPMNPPYHPFGPACKCGGWHVWFGTSPALLGVDAPCPNFDGDYSAPRVRCKVSPWELASSPDQEQGTACGGK